MEEERLIGFDDGPTDVGGSSLSDDQRHALLGNSFSVPVVWQLLKKPKALGDVDREEGRGDMDRRKAAQEALRLVALNTPRARERCGQCESRKCQCV